MSLDPDAALGVPDRPITSPRIDDFAWLAIFRTVSGRTPG
jgi:hypothetical protein